MLGADGFAVLLFFFDFLEGSASPDGSCWVMSHLTEQRHKQHHVSWVQRGWKQKVNHCSEMLDVLHNVSIAHSPRLHREERLPVVGKPIEQ
jgi:hypothetical protein